MSEETITTNCQLEAITDAPANAYMEESRLESEHKAGPPRKTKVRITIENDTKGQAPYTKSKTKRMPDIKALLSSIRDKYQAIIAEERNAPSSNYVTRAISLGQDLNALKQVAKNMKLSWQEQVKNLAMVPRVAQRYQRIAKCWAGDGEKRLSESFFEALPADLEKLDILSKLPLDQLKQMSRDHDLKKLDRTGVADLVRTVRGKRKSQKKKDPALILQKIAQRFFLRSNTVIEHWRMDGLNVQKGEEFLAVLDKGIADLRNTLMSESSVGPAPDANGLPDTA
jgi:hypothetical protein